MEMIRTFRIIATDKESHAIRDYKYTESFSMSGSTATVQYYDDEFMALSTDTIDLDLFEISGMPNKTSRKGVYYKKKPLPTIASLLPVVAVFKYVPFTIPVNIPMNNINIVKPVIAISKAGKHTLNVSVPVITPAKPTVTIST